MDRHRHRSIEYTYCYQRPDRIAKSLDESRGQGSVARDTARALVRPRQC